MTTVVLPPRRPGDELGPVGRPFPIVAAGRDRGGLLLAVVASLAFLAAMAGGGAGMLARESARWQAALAGEATIQVRPVAGRDPEADVNLAAALAGAQPGIASADVRTREASERLLEPWLGAGLELRDLPVPRLVVLRFAAGEARPDLRALASRLRSDLPNASLDDHGAWLTRLSRGATGLMLAAGGAVLLILGASAGAVAVSTRGAVVGQREVVEVLHYVGASPSDVARLFANRFARLAGLGGLIGSTVAAAALWGAVRTVEWSADGGQSWQDAAWLVAAVGIVTLADAVLAGLVASATVRRVLRETS